MLRKSPTLTGYRKSLQARLRHASKLLDRNPSNFEAEVDRIRLLHALETLDRYARTYDSTD